MKFYTRFDLQRNEDILSTDTIVLSLAATYRYDPVLCTGAKMKRVYSLTV